MVPRVKVLKFVTAFAVGGTERQFVHLTSGLDRSRFDIQIGCFHRSGPLLNEISALDIPISEYPTTSFYSYEAVRAQLRLAQTIRRERVQLVHAYGSYPNLFAVPAARLARNCVSIASLRDLGLFSGGNKLKGAAQKLAFSFADCVLANSNAARNWLLNQGVKQERVHVIPNGINVARFKPAPDDCDFPIRREFNIDPKAPLVTLVCRTDRNKGLEGFMDVVPIVANRFPDVRFMLVGGSPSNPCYEIDIRNLAARRNRRLDADHCPRAKRHPLHRRQRQAGHDLHLPGAGDQQRGRLGLERLGVRDHASRGLRIPPPAGNLSGRAPILLAVSIRPSSTS